MDSKTTRKVAIFGVSFIAAKLVNSWLDSALLVILIAIIVWLCSPGEVRDKAE